MKQPMIYEIAPVFNDDEDQSRWFYFQSNGKKVQAKDGDLQKSKTINGKKYEFDQYGAMTAEWSLDVEAGFYTSAYKRRLQHISYQQCIC